MYIVKYNNNDKIKLDYIGTEKAMNIVFWHLMQMYVNTNINITSRF